MLIRVSLSMAMEDAETAILSGCRSRSAASLALGDVQVWPRYHEPKKAAARYGLTHRNPDLHH